MRLRLPELRVGWPAFAGEVGVIVLGVLIALGVDQAAQSVGHSRDAAEARENINAEIIANITRVKQRDNAEACVDTRLDELQAMLDRVSADGKIERPGWIGQPPRYGIESQRWQAALQSGRVSHFESDEQAHYGFVYTALAYYYEMQNNEQLVWSRLSALQGVDRLSADGLLAMRSAIGEARFYSFSIGNIVPILFSGASEMGLAPTRRIDRPANLCWPMNLTPSQAQARQEAANRPR